MLGINTLNEESSEDLRNSGAYIALVLIWSTTPLAVVLGVRDINPIWSLSIRFIIAITIASIILWCIRQPLPLNKVALRCYFAGTLGLFWAMLFTYLGAQYLPSGLISLIFGLSPIFAGLAGHFTSEKLKPAQWLGMIISILGLIGIFGSVHMQTGMLKGMIYVLLGVIAYVGSIYWLLYEKSNLHPVAQTTGSLALSTIGLIILLPFYWSVRPMHYPEQTTILAILYSATFSSIAAMVCYFYLIKRIQPSTLSLATVITPVLALILGSWLNNEEISSTMLVGIAVVISGLIIYFANDLFSRPTKALKLSEE
jgi:drug/metabolite transporter (DMT)-like permease